MPVLNLPEPDNWPASRRRLGWLMVFVIVFVAFGVAFGVRAVVRGDYFLAAMLFGLQVPFLIAMFTIQLVARGHTSLNADFDTSGTTLRSDRVSAWLMIVMIATFIPLGIYYVVFTMSGDLVMFAGSRVRLGSIVSMGFAAVLSAWGLVSAWRRGGVGYVKLTPVGIDIADMVRTKCVVWSDIDSMADHSETKKTRKAVVLNCSDGAENVIGGADFYVPGGAALYWMVRHYWQHPGDRAELVDERALDRLSEGRFDVA